MAEDRRYFWVKLDYRRFESGGDLDFLLGQRNGAQYVVLYLMLCLNLRNSQGVFISQMGEVIIPYDVDRIVRDCKYFSRDTVMVALELYRKLGIIYEQEDGVLRISNFDEVVGSEGGSARRMRLKRSRDSQGELTSDVTEDVTDDAQCAHNVTHNVRTNCSQSDLDVTQEIRDKRKEKRNKSKDGFVGAEPSTRKAPAPTASASLKTTDDDPVLISIPTVSDGDWPVTRSWVETMQPLYPAVDVMAQLRAVRAWALSNPTRRKTASGMPRFLNRWLSEEQNKGASSLQRSRQSYMTADNSSQYADDARRETWEEV